MLPLDARDGFPLEKAAFRFMRTITAHPFRDGNGRLARMLICAPFAAAGLLNFPVLGFNAIFDIHRIELSQKVQKLSSCGNWPEFIEYLDFLLRECVRISEIVAHRDARVGFA